MGSQSDWETMQNAAETLAALAIPHEIKVVSAHRTPDLMFEKFIKDFSTNFTYLREVYHTVSFLFRMK